MINLIVDRLYLIDTVLRLPGNLYFMVTIVELLGSAIFDSLVVVIICSIEMLSPSPKSS